MVGHAPSSYIRVCAYVCIDDLGTDLLAALVSFSSRWCSSWGDC